MRVFHQEHGRPLSKGVRIPDVSINDLQQVFFDHWDTVAMPRSQRLDQVYYDREIDAFTAALVFVHKLS